MRHNAKHKKGNFSMSSTARFVFKRAQKFPSFTLPRSNINELVRAPIYRRCLITELMTKTNCCMYRNFPSFDCGERRCRVGAQNADEKLC